MFLITYFWSFTLALFLQILFINLLNSETKIDYLINGQKTMTISNYHQTVKTNVLLNY